MIAEIDTAWFSPEVLQSSKYCCCLGNSSFGSSERRSAFFSAILLEIFFTLKTFEDTLGSFTFSRFFYKRIRNQLIKNVRKNAETQIFVQFVFEIHKTLKPEPLARINFEHFLIFFAHTYMFTGEEGSLCHVQKCFGRFKKLIKKRCWINVENSEAKVDQTIALA
ncbi:hypothetical protein BpHYR1_004132 [Brachionus plicatilis]|uniref:Uncharacterized protein n=1 Tax=Brachionus plicatilis TaxID=10195 RepID=A0A3M7QH43_BRAPC|nr:hypothetical protein BpHYR1_004132 [Brachionus plicatilis]